MARAGEGSLLQYFRRAAEIEISSDEEGFRGSWYEGIVIRPPKDFSSRVHVEYKTLLNNSGKRRLREMLKVVQLRPAQPKEIRLAFKFSDEVDAYYNEGWWEGVITEILENEEDEDEYMVFFRGTREQISFKASKLRLHREWVAGAWVPPLDHLSCPDIVPVAERTLSSAEAESDVEIAEYIYNPGDLVEASSDEEGLEGAFFAATVLERLTAGKYLIQYKNLKDENELGLLTEEVNGLHLRPSPPDVDLLDSFVLNDEVDAWVNDCWWVGVIWKVLKNDRYVVLFKKTNELTKFDHSNLRVHQEWRNGKWHIASKVVK